MTYTLLLFASLLGQAPEYTVQDFNTAEECVEAGVTIAQAYHDTFFLPQIVAQCFPGYRL